MENENEELPEWANKFAEILTEQIIKALKEQEVKK